MKWGRRGRASAETGWDPPLALRLDLKLPGPVGLTQATQICANDFAGAEPSGPIGKAEAQHGVRGINPFTPSCTVTSPNPALDIRQAGWSP